MSYNIMIILFFNEEKGTGPSYHHFTSTWPFEVSSSKNLQDAQK